MGCIVECTNLDNTRRTLMTRDLEAFTFPMPVARLDDLSPEAVIDLLLPEEKT